MSISSESSEPFIISLSVVTVAATTPEKIKIKITNAAIEAFFTDRFSPESI
jgi:hypothetical protein